VTPCVVASCGGARGPGLACRGRAPRQAARGEPSARLGDSDRDHPRPARAFVRHAAKGAATRVLTGSKGIEAAATQAAALTRRPRARGASASRRHPANEVAHFPGEGWATSALPRRDSHRPVQPKASTVPTDDCLRLDDEKGVRPARPQPPKGDPEGSVGGPDERASPRRQGGKLLARGKVLEQEIALGTEGREKHPYRYR